MNWFFWRKKRSQRLEEACRAREQAEKALRQTQALTPIYEGLAEAMKEFQDHNHFGEMIAAAFRQQREQ